MMNKHPLVQLLCLLLLSGLLTACNEVDTKITAAQDGMETKAEEEIETITSDDLDKISRQLDVTLPAALSGSYQDSHGGFHGDGLAFGQIVFSAADGADIAAMLSSRESWQPFPVSENLTVLLYGDAERQSILTDTGMLPEIQEGYWYFYDRFRQSTDPSSDRELLSRAAYNFTAALYDAQQYTLYYVEFDT